MTLLLMAASLRKESFNKKLMSIAHQILQKQKVATEILNFAKEADLPLYNEDIETGQGIPEIVKQCAQKLKAADGLVLVSPEYNFSTPGILKNWMDWISRVRPMPFKSLPILLMSASPSLCGGNRGLLHTNISLEICGAHIFPNLFSVSSAHKAFTPDGQFKDAKLEKQLTQLCTAFVKFTQLMKPERLEGFLT